MHNVTKVSLAHLTKLVSVLVLVFFAVPVFAQQAAETASPQSASPPVEKALALERKKIPALEKRESLRILYYKPIYFAYQNPLSKVQFSFRAPLTEKIPINFAYSQIIFWELYADSKPFRDATYNPELFYRLKMGNDHLQSIDFGLWEHNSNGKDGPTSRSYDQTYVRLNYAFEGRRWITQFSGKVRFLYNKDDTSGNIYDYISPLEFQLAFIQLFDSWFDESELTLDLKPGGRFGERLDLGGYQVGLSFRFGGLQIIPAFYIQYYHGYAETLVSFDQRVDQFRAGFLF